ncbi:unnamed protein product [Sphagnum jensenii]
MLLSRSTYLDEPCRSRNTLLRGEGIPYRMRVAAVHCGAGTDAPRVDCVKLCTGGFVNVVLNSPKLLGKYTFLIVPMVNPMACSSAITGAARPGSQPTLRHRRRIVLSGGACSQESREDVQEAWEGEVLLRPSRSLCQKRRLRLRCLVGQDLLRGSSTIASSPTSSLGASACSTTPEAAPSCRGSPDSPAEVTLSCNLGFYFGLLLRNLALQDHLPIALAGEQTKLNGEAGSTCIVDILEVLKTGSSLIANGYRPKPAEVLQLHQSLLELFVAGMQTCKLIRVFTEASAVVVLAWFGRWPRERSSELGGIAMPHGELSLARGLKLLLLNGPCGYLRLQVALEVFNATLLLLLYELCHRNSALRYESTITVSKVVNPQSLQRIFTVETNIAGIEVVFEDIINDNQAKVDDEISKFRMLLERTVPNDRERKIH